ncbi:kinesin-like protein KIF20B [Monomorium pharaonis]|uniref:kinesin-like protein KIF20B n=1 Tax=Monomorium pharaonis TaxID=307658 RepID=UPI0017461E14|nr:kinesin-like protein KIF20B [Monomorium pharaonis]XP_036140561.1 kinesin-like protein KIF20B [Monomorium pharaonis]
MTSTVKNPSERPDTYASRCGQEMKTSFFPSPRCNKRITDMESRRASKVSASTVEMYLRIRPTPETLIPKSYAVFNPRTLLTFLPFEDKSSRNSRCARSSEAGGGRQHTFTKIFGSETSQAEVFEGSIKHRVAEFLGGKSSTIMTYGTRDSGKTYTLFGTPASPGVITRSIDLVFSAINCTIAPWYKPTFQSTVLRLNETARAAEMELKARVLDGRSTSAEARLFLENLRPADADPPDECEGCCSESMCAVWLSFAEIYNGNVYDLLDDAETRSPLRLYMNAAQGRAYVCGLQKVHAITALEACRILMAGQSRLRTVANPESRGSPSHTIFTMELLRYQKDHAAEEVTLSTLTFCDLAGSTHFEKSHIREVSNVNNSLVVLGRCLKAVSQNQMAPFRQSKLTRICQRALSGEENLNVIVNIAFRLGLSDETQGIFSFCDIVRKLLNNHRKEFKQLCELGETPHSLETCDDDFMASPFSQRSSFETAESTGCTDSVACRNIREQNRRLERELEVVKSDLLNCEYAIRQQLADHYSRMIEDLEATYKENTKKLETDGHDLLKWSVRQVENFYKGRIDNLRHKKRRRRDSGDYVDDSRVLYEELKAENAQVTSKMVILKEAMKKLKKENETILCEKNNCSFQLALVTEELKKFRQLAQAGIRKWGGNIENIKNDADCLMNNLEGLMDEKLKRTRKKLEEMSEYMRAVEKGDAKITSAAQQESSKSENLLNDTLIKIRELKEELSRKEACIVKLQHHAQLRERQLAEIQQRLTDTQNENMIDEKCKCDRSTNISFDDTADSIFLDNMSVEKTSLRMCVNSSAVEQHEFNDWIIVSTNHVESTKKFSNVSNVDCKTLESNTDCKISRSSDRSSKDDSGVSCELQNESRRSISVSDRTSIRENEDKSTQTCVVDQCSQMEKTVESFRIDGVNSKKCNYQETLHVTELSQNLETIRDVIYALNETACANECQCLRKEGALERLTEEDSEVAAKRDDLFKAMENKMQEYKCEIRELIRRLVVKEENESRISKWLERYIEKSQAFENQLSLMRKRLDKAFSKCANEHLPRIDSLEEEVLQKTLQINELDGKVAEMQHELAKGDELLQKIHDFEIIGNRCQRDRNELCRRLYECSETQLNLEDKLKKLTMMITKREGEVISLKSEVRNIADLNVANSKKARNLGEQINETSESIDSAKEYLHYCKDLRKNVEDTMKAQIHDFRSRFSELKNSTALQNEIYKTYGDNQDEITRLKMQLEHKELEVILLKTNRDAKIQKYEILMRHFQNEIEEKEKHFKTVANSSNNSEGFSAENQRQPEEIIKDHETESSFASSSCFVPEHASSVTLNVSPAPSEDSTTFSDEKDGISIKFGDDKTCQTDSSVKSNVHSSETDRSEMEGNFNMRSPDIKDTKEILDWMKVRRISGKTALSRLSAKHADINSDSE